MEDASSSRKGTRSRIPLVIAVLWTGLITVAIIGVAATADDFGLNSATVGGLLMLWILGLALGRGIRAAVRWWRSGPARERIVPIVVGFAVCAVFAGVVYAGTSGAGRSRPLARLRWTDETPAWSPNGQEIVFASNRAHPKSGIDHLYLMSPNGSHLRRLTHDRLDAREPNFSPDGRRIVYAANVLDSSNDYTKKGTIDLISTDGTHQRSLTSGLRGDASGPTWSPDGRWIAFVDAVSTDSGAGSRSDLYVVRRDGTGLRRLAIDIDDWSQPLAWAPDSRQIAVVGADERLYRIGVDATKPVRVTSEKWGVVTTDVAWSPDGKRIALVRGRIDVSTCFCDADGSEAVDRYLWILDLGTGRRHRVRSLTDSGSLGDFGVTVTWLHRRTPTLAAFDVPRTVLLTAAGHKLRALKTPNGGMLTPGSASPNGRELLFVDSPDNSYESAIFVGNAVSGRVLPLTQRSRAAS
jgi:Tol biopolymer transport system component